MPSSPPRRDNAVLVHHPDAVDVGGEKLMGRQAAGAEFLRGFVRHSGVDRFLCQVFELAHDEDFAARVAIHAGEQRPCVNVTLPGMVELTDTERTLFVPDPALGPHAWRRRGIGARQYSLCGINHTIASDGAMDNIGAILTAPVQPWDALICTSRAAKAVVTRLLDNQADFLSRRGGGAFTAQVKIPVIPLGVDCDRFANGDERDRIRASLRRGLGIAEDDVVFLFFGRLSFHAKAHPLPMYLALEEAANRTGRRVHLLQTGRFPNEGIEQEFRSGAREYAPNVNIIFLDGRDDAVCRDVWYAADVFTSLSDNVQESFGLTPVEAMAAGLPCVVTDWNGYRDTVRDGEDGFAIPTWVPLAGSGGDLALQNDALVSDLQRDRNYNHYCGVVSQFTAVDISKTADAYTALIENEGRREGMGASGRQRARSEFDWRVVIEQYQALWRELAHVRARSQEIAGLTEGRPVHPLRDDPFTLFGGYASGVVDGSTSVRLVEPDKQAAMARLRKLRSMPMNDFAAAAMLPQEALEHLLQTLSDGVEREVIDIAEPIAEELRYRLPRTLSWLAKLGIVELSASEQGVVDRFSSPNQTDAGDVARLVELGSAAGRRGALQAASDYFVQALRIDPGDVAANTEMGVLQAQQGDHPAALGSFERALNRDPGNLRARQNLGKAMVISGRVRSGIAALEQTAAQHPEDSETQYLLGAAYRRMGEANKALACLERCVELEPGRADALTHLGHVRQSLGRRDAAFEAFRRGFAADPKNAYARAEILNLEAEQKGQQNLANAKSAKRVALHFNRRGQFARLDPVFQALRADHWPYLTGDGRSLQEFGPDVVILAGDHVDALRDLAPKAKVVNLLPGLASENFFTRVADPGDIICVTSDAVANDIKGISNLTDEQIWVTGQPALDIISRGQFTPRPAQIDEAAPTVLYAPSERPNMSSIGAIMRDPIHYLRGTRTDVNLILKPHPDVGESGAEWLDQWIEESSREDNVFVCTNPTVPAVNYMAHADVLVSDTGSAMLEFLVMDRPIIRVLNPDKFRDETHYDPSGYEWMAGDMATEVQDVELLSERVLGALDGDDPAQKGRRMLREHLFGNLLDGGAAVRIGKRVSQLKLS